MARQVIYSHRAIQDRKEILSFWITHNHSNTYSIKLNSLFVEAVRLISIFPKIGKLTSNKNARVHIVKHYLVIYELQNEIIHILTIWDSRRNPDNLKSRIKK